MSETKCSICNEIPRNPVKTQDRFSGRLLDIVCSKCLKDWQRLYSSEIYVKDQCKS